MSKIKVGIVGAAGYTGGELIRILLRHPLVEISQIQSKSQGGKPIYATHTDLIGETDLTFMDTLDFSTLDVLFLCSGHGQSKKFFDENSIPSNIKVIDLSTDFRDESHGFVYGLPELNFLKISKASKIANPGCFATAIQLAILPLAHEGLLKNEVHVSATTGSTGAGQALSNTTHFSWRSNNLSTYKAFNHQHLAEINQSVKQLQKDFNQDINFIPYRGNFTRGILANVYTTFEGSLEDAQRVYRRFYAEAAFTHVIDQDLDLHMVVNSNKCLLQLQKHGSKLLVTSAIDNLTKGASGQAIQNMNIAFGLDQTTGLTLKTVGF
ncbi:MAG: N-acetyl-gamma-glutamyl-phosphate reductase [Leadbetterella sp.]